MNDKIKIIIINLNIETNIIKMFMSIKILNILNIKGEKKIHLYNKF